MILLHPVPPMGIFYQALQGRTRPEVAPIVAPLAVGAILADQPAGSPLPRRVHPPGPQGDESPAHPPPAPFPPGDRPPRPRRLGPDPLIDSPGRPAPPAQAHSEVGADSDHVGLPSLLQAGQEVGVVA